MGFHKFLEDDIGNDLSIRNIIRKYQSHCLFEQRINSLEYKKDCYKDKKMTY